MLPYEFGKMYECVAMLSVCTDVTEESVSISGSTHRTHTQSSSTSMLQQFIGSFWFLLVLYTSGDTLTVPPQADRSPLDIFTENYKGTFAFLFCFQNN